MSPTTLIALDRECLHRLRKNPVEFVRLLQWALMETGDPGYAKTKLRIDYGVTLVPDEPGLQQAALEA